MKSRQMEEADTFVEGVSIGSPSVGCLHNFGNTSYLPTEPPEAVSPTPIVWGSLNRKTVYRVKSMLKTTSGGIN